MFTFRFLTSEDDDASLTKAIHLPMQPENCTIESIEIHWSVKRDFDLHRRASSSYISCRCQQSRSKDQMNPRR